MCPVKSTLRTEGRKLLEPGNNITKLLLTYSYNAEVCDSGNILLNDQHRQAPNWEQYFLPK